MDPQSKIYWHVHVVTKLNGPVEDLPMTDAICALLEKGVMIKTACGICGIHVATYCDWRAKGLEWADSDDAPEKERIYVEFARRTARAREAGFAFHELNLQKGAEKDPRLSLEYLARRRIPERERPEMESYARETQKLEHSGSLEVLKDSDLDERIEFEIGRLVAARETQATRQSSD